MKPNFFCQRFFVLFVSDVKAHDHRPPPQTSWPLPPHSRGFWNTHNDVHQSGMTPLDE